MEAEHEPFDLDDTGKITVDVPLGDREYAIKIGSNVASSFASETLNALGDLSHALVIADESVLQHWASPIAESLRQASANHSLKVDVTTVPSGEPSKSIDHYNQLLEWMLEKSADRRSVVVAVGGGVVGDLAGFAAASFTRGVRFIQVPTTLLAMVDSSVGGKTGINLPGAKNMVGSFWQPSLVWIDTDFLTTLDDRTYLSGLGEVIKYGVIDDADFFVWLEVNAEKLVARDSTTLRYAIARSCQSKANVVGEDERETSGRRAILNYGHTFAHAIEATAGYGTLLHGEAVTIGMQMAARLAIAIGICEPSLLERQTKLITDCGLPIKFPEADASRMLPVMRRDKKVAHGKLRFILPTTIGSVNLVGDVDESKVIEAINQSS